jgi:hypothetical protein
MRWVDGFSVCPIDDSVTSSYEEVRHRIEPHDPDAGRTVKVQANLGKSAPPGTEPDAGRSAIGERRPPIR